MSWYRDAATGSFVCSLCEARAKRDEGEMRAVRRFEASTAQDMREHFRGHRDRPQYLWGDFIYPEKQPLDVLDAGEMVELERLAVAEMSFDGECETLARAFLADYPKATDYDAARLAQVVQVAVEEWLEEEMKP